MCRGVVAHRLQTGGTVRSSLGSCGLAFFVLVPFELHAQTSTTAGPPQTVCNLPIPAPAQEPPAGTSPVIFQIVPCFDRQGNISMVEPETYLHYIQTSVSRPSQHEWVPYDDKGSIDSPGLQAAVGDRIPRRPDDRSDRLPLRERHRGQVDRHEMNARSSIRLSQLQQPYALQTLGRDRRDDRRLTPRNNERSHRHR